MRGTLLNTATVAAGALIGHFFIGKQIPDSYQSVVMNGIALVTIAMGVKMFLSSKNVLIVIGAVALGGILGVGLGITSGFEVFSQWAKEFFGAQGDGRFTEAVVMTSVLFCVGPLTLLGCLEDGLEGKSDLLQLKAIMDGFGAVIFAATMGIGVLLTALVVLVVQGTLTLLAKPLRPLAKDAEFLAEITATGGIVLMVVGVSIMQIKQMSGADYVPALFLAPLFVALARTWTAKRRPLPGEGQL